MLPVLLLALLPAAGNLVGGVLAEVLPESPRWRGLALHAAVGVVFGVVGIEILPEALGVLDAWQLAAAFVTGGLAYLLVRMPVEASGGGEDSARMWMIYVAVATDLFGDGLMIGAASSVGSGLGATVAIGQILADIPEGAATILTLRGNQVPRHRRLLISASFVLPALTGAVISYLVLRSRPEAWQLAALVGTAGLFTVAVFEDMIREAHETEDSRTSTLMLLGGFVAFTLVSGGLG